MTELKTCPFCGGKAKTVCDVTCGYEFFRVFCTDCHAQANYGWSEAEAIESWNTRAEQTCHNTKTRDFHFTCSGCGYEFSSWGGFGCDFGDEPDFAYCPNCGAKVVER